MEYRPERYLIHRRVSMTDRGGSRRCIRVTAFQDRSMVPDSLQSAQFQSLRAARFDRRKFFRPCKLGNQQGSG